MPRVWIAFVAALLGMGGILWGEWFFLEAKKRMAGVMVGAAGVALVAVALAIK